MYVDCNYMDIIRLLAFPLLSERPYVSCNVTQLLTHFINISAVTSINDEAESNRKKVIYSMISMGRTTLRR